MAKCGSYTLSSIIDNSCLDNMGGIKTVYMVESDLVTAVEAGSVGDVNKIGTITLAEEGKWKKFTFRKGTSNMTSTAEINEQNGTCSFKTDVNLKFAKANDKNRTSIMGMILSGSKAVVEDAMGHYWFLGQDFDVTASAASQETGTAYGDFTGYNVTLSDTSRELPRELTTEAVQALVAAIEPAPVL